MSRISNFTKSVDYAASHGAGPKRGRGFVSPREMRKLVSEFKQLSPEEQQAALKEIAKKRPLVAKMLSKKAKPMSADQGANAASEQAGTSGQAAPAPAPSYAGGMQGMNAGFGGQQGMQMLMQLLNLAKQMFGQA